MAKKKKDKSPDFDQNDGEKGKGKTGTILMIVLIVLIWIGIFALLIKLDVGGIGSNVLRPLIKDIPIINKILPSASDDQIIFENNYPYKDIEEAVAVIKDLEKQLEALKDTSSAENYPEVIAELQAEIDRLKVFEETQVAFEERVKEFDEDVVFNSQAPTVEEYIKYYESINPETAAEIYRQIMEQKQYDEAIKEKADILRKMKPANAAAVIEQMNADTEWICKVLLSMKTEECTAILDKMQALSVARILKKMQDMDQERMLSIQNQMK